MNIQVGGRAFVEAAQAVDTRSVAEMVSAWFATETSLKNDDRLTGAELDRVMNAHSALEELILRKPSRTQNDFIAKLRFAMAMTVNAAGYWGHEREILANVAYECAHMCDRDNDGERDIAEKAGSYEEYFRLKGMPMPERTAA